MEYKEIIEEINAIDDANFTIEDFKKLARISKEIDIIYKMSIASGKMDASIHYDIVKDHLFTVVFKTLKQKLDFDDEVINSMMGLIDYASLIEDVYILDGNIIVKIIDSSREIILPLGKFYNIVSSNFNQDRKKNSFRNLFVKSVNNSITPLLNNPIEDNKLLEIEDNHFIYRIPNINIYANHSLNEMMEKNENYIPQITKIIVSYNNDLYYFDMKVHNNSIMFFYNDYPIHRLSEILKEKSKIKKL